MKSTIWSFFLLLSINLMGQDYFLSGSAPYDSEIMTPEAFLGYPIGFQHTRHDRITDYFKYLGDISDRAEYLEYGKTYEGRKLVMLKVSSKSNIENAEGIRENHMLRNHPETSESASADMPVIVNLGYNVHGNEPSSAEAAMLCAYIVVSSENSEIERIRQDALVFIDPVINPDGRDRHTQWVNAFKGKTLIDDPMDIEHNEAWPRGRTNHYWFDLNRDWWLAIHPESRGKLNWYHKWYPNVVTDFHEMGTNSTYFFEPMKDNASANPIMPRENYTTLNDSFAVFYSKALDAIGSFYFTKEVFDGTYPGYGSSYPDLQGGLGILFEQASSRGHLQKTESGKITFPFTIRNQLTTSLATLEASITHKSLLFEYQKMFFRSAVENAQKDKIKAYYFGELFDQNRLLAFLDKLDIHRVEYQQIQEEVKINDMIYPPGTAYVVPTDQIQYRMVQSVFETYDTYRDSVYYDASAWSLANFYNINYEGKSTSKMPKSSSIAESTQAKIGDQGMAYIIPWEDYNAPALLNKLQLNGIKVYSAFKPFEIETDKGLKEFGYGTLLIPVSKQETNTSELHEIISMKSKAFNIPVFVVNTSYSVKGVDLGSRNFNFLEKPGILSFVGDGISGYEAGELWYLMDQKLGMPMTKALVQNFKRLDLDNYNTMILVSGTYGQLDSTDKEKIKSWIAKGNTLITTRGGTDWAVKNKLVDESMFELEKSDSEVQARYPYVKAREIEGRKSVGGAIFEINLDITHPIGFGYRSEKLPVYRNSNYWLAPSNNPYSNVALYSDDPHIDGFISDENLEDRLKKSASIIVSTVGSGRVILFAENPNFRGSWYGTNKLFFNAIFLGSNIRVPNIRNVQEHIH